MLPSRKCAEELLKEAEKCNPGPWGNHSRIAAYCAETIASFCNDLDSEKAYILGLLHDIGRKFGVRHLGHVSDGYSYMMELGYDEVARVCLTHSFVDKSTKHYVGKFDTTPEELELIENTLKSIEYDEYDSLIQLCDALAGSDCIMNVEDRMNDVKRRYGYYPQDKWDRNIYLIKYFESKMNKELYSTIDKDNFKL